MGTWAGLGCNLRVKLFIDQKIVILKRFKTSDLLQYSLMTGPVKNYFESNLMARLF